MHKAILLFLIIGTASSALASQPGHPLDCSDWVFLEPGYSCSPFISYPCPSTGGNPKCFVSNDDRATTNEGDLLRVRRVCSSHLCADGDICRIEIWTWNNSGERIIGYVQDRCVDPNVGGGNYEIDVLDLPGRIERQMEQDVKDALIKFDSTNGRLLITVQSRCGNSQTPCPYQESGQPNGIWTAAITGFTPLFEVMQTYTPTESALQFRVPAHPEGLHSTDLFDTYWGHVSDLPDFNQAQPMVCHYPDMPPADGTYLTVTDTSPQPAAGHANYTVTAVTHAGQRRYGRQRIGTTLSGRNPALLPGCPYRAGRSSPSRRTSSGACQLTGVGPTALPTCRAVFGWSGS